MMPGDEGETIHVLFCIDAGYAQQAAVAADSLLRVTSGPVAIHVAMLSVDEAAVTLMAHTVAAHPRANLTIHGLSGQLFADLPVTVSFPASIYTRIVFDRFMPPSVGRVLYCDADIVVCKDVRALWKTDLGDAVAAVVRDPFRLDLPSLGFAVDEAYFNSGVLLIDRQRWCACNAEWQVLSVIQERGTALPWMDQDALNLVLRGQVRFVSPEWNCQPRFADFPAGFLGLDPQDYERLRHDPAIVHFTTTHKPWTASFRVHYSDRFFAARRAARLPVPLRPRRPRTRAERLLALKTWMCWRFPGSFRTLRRLIRPAAAARMYAAGPGD